MRGTSGHPCLNPIRVVGPVIVQSKPSTPIASMFPLPENTQVLSGPAAGAVPEQVFVACAGEHDDEWATLERIKWEYIHFVVSNSRSLAEAARRLGLQARSLRRMLQRLRPTR